MKPRTSLTAAVALVLAGSLGSAQVVTTGTILVVVEAQDGSRLPGADVTAQAADVTTKRRVVADAQGEALLVNLMPSANYVVTVVMPGFQTVRHERVLVRSGQTTALPTSLGVATATEQLTVTAESPLVDTTNATQGQDITLELTESLPTGRSYQSYLQLVPGVMPDDPAQPGNPASKSGLNYADIAGESGISRDNFYYFDGINVTDPETGTFGANMNTEIIQEQKVLTGGLPAEFVGAAGLISNVVTKSGSNTFHGSANYFFQNQGLVAENENAPGQDFSTFDTAATLGGPLVADQAWFFASYRRLERDDDVTSLDTNEFLRKVNNTQDQVYAKVTWAPTANDTVSGTFMNDPTTVSGRRERDITNALDRSREQGGNRYNLNYSHLFGGRAVLELGYSRHDADLSDFSAIREERSEVKFRATDARTLADEQLGGYGFDSVTERGTRLFRGALEWRLSGHTVKGGVEFLKNRQFRNELTIGDTSSQFYSLATHLSGITARQLVEGSFSGSSRFDPFNTSDFAGFMNSVDSAPNRDSFYAAFDVNHDGAITPDELADRLVYDSTAGNPQGRINYDRAYQVEDGPQDFRSTGLSFFAQDTARFGRLTINAGLRSERFKHFSTLNDNIYTFDWTWAPRLSATYDVRGDGRQKLSAYYGRYYDPIRQNMTRFAGSHSGRTRLEQVFVNGEWVTYRVRGGASLDAIFSPVTKTPYTDDLQFGYQIDLGNSMALEALYTKRWTRNILEDYDPSIYTDPSSYPGPLDHPDSLFLGWEHFGFPETGLPGAANFFIATLEGGARDYQGIELTWRRRYQNNWQALVSYTLNDADGSSNSDSNADFQGDVIYLDPRAPNQYGRQPGSIRHLFKAAGSYHFDFGLLLGAFYRWNSGTLASRTFLASGRHLPNRVSAAEAFDYAGITTRWLAEDSVGSLGNPSWGQLDLRVEYKKRYGGVLTEIFVDVFNVFDKQGSIRDQDLVAGAGGIAFGEPVLYLDPRRFFLGARLSF